MEMVVPPVWGGPGWSIPPQSLSIAAKGVSGPACPPHQEKSANIAKVQNCSPPIFTLFYFNFGVRIKVFFSVLIN